MIDERVYSIFRFYSHTQTNKEWSTFLLYSGILSNCFLKVWILWWFSFSFLCSVVVTNTDEVQSIGVQSIMAGKWEGRVKKPPAGREENRLYIVQNAEKKNRLNNDSNDWCTLNSDDTDPHNNVIFYRFVSCLVRDLNIYIYAGCSKWRKTNEYTVAFPGIKTKENKQEVAIKYWWWRTKKRNHNDSSKNNKKRFWSDGSHRNTGGRAAAVDIQEHDVMELDATHFLIRRRHFFSIARFRGTHPPNPHIYARNHAICTLATQAHAAEKRSWNTQRLKIKQNKKPIHFQTNQRNIRPPLELTNWWI